MMISLIGPIMQLKYSKMYHMYTVYQVYERGEQSNSKMFRRSTSILQICWTDDILDYVKPNQENHLGHIDRQKITSIVKRPPFNEDQNKRRGRPIKILEDYVLKGKSADNIYREALKKTKKDTWLQP